MKCLGPHIPMCAASEARGRSKSVHELRGRGTGGRRVHLTPLSKRAMVDPQSPFFVRQLATSFMVAAWRCKRVAGRSRVELVKTRREMCLASSNSYPVQSNEVRRAAQWPPWAGPPRAGTQAAGSPLSSACPGGFGIGRPAQGRHSRPARWPSQPLSTGARYSGSVVHLHHRGARIRCDIITSRARQLDMCGTALLSLQDP